MTSCMAGDLYYIQPWPDLVTGCAGRPGTVRSEKDDQIRQITAKTTPH